jgi:pimeloyl-ACP methyl ester carboxylesterase
VSKTSRVLTVAAGAAGVAAAGGALRVAHRRSVISRRGAGDHTPFGSLRSKPISVVTDDGVDLHVEVDEFVPPKRRSKVPELTVVFIHGYSLNLDSWHFQRAAYRDQVRAVYYDQRSHGRSGRSTPGHATIDQLAHDLMAGARLGRPGGPDRAGRSLHGRDDDHRARRAAPRAVRRPRSSASA